MSQRISEIFIKNFKCLNGFSLDLNNTQDKTLNLNLIIGKNGAGKSTFLDALYEIAAHTNNPDAIFQHYLKGEDGKIICGNCSDKSYEKCKPTIKENYWYKVLRFYTGNSNRNIEYKNEITENTISLDRDDAKFALSAIFLSGAWSAPGNNDILDIFKKLVFSNKKIFEPVQVWLDVANYNKDSFEIKNLDFIEKKYNKKTRLYITIEDITDKISSFSVLHTLLNSFRTEPDEYGELRDPNIIINTGFLYKLNNKNDSDLYNDETLSDGELGFIRRFALIMLLRELKGEDNSSLLLLDEPETHFNENWKRHFIYLIEEALKDTYHDVFIATHSAMLITDVKRDELYRFDCVNDKIKTYPVCLNTYAANIVDIGQFLFDLESDIGERSKQDIEAALSKGNKTELNALLGQVGPGEWRWKIRAKLNQLEKTDSCCNYKQKTKEL